MSELSGDLAHADKRAYPRFVPSRLLEVCDLHGEPLGQLSNLSRGGFMLISAREMSASQRYDFIVGDDERAVRLSARCVWCQRSSYSNDYGAGFEIEAVIAADRPRFESWFD